MTVMKAAYEVMHAKYGQHKAQSVVWWKPEFIAETCCECVGRTTSLSLLYSAWKKTNVIFVSIIQLNSSLLTKGSWMAKRIQYIKTNQMMKVNEVKQ